MAVFHIHAGKFSVLHYELEQNTEITIMQIIINFLISTNSNIFRKFGLIAKNKIEINSNSIIQ